MTARELIAPIENFAPLYLQESWDNCGFSVGNPEQIVTHALVALDCTEAVLDEAISMGCDIIITHHPLIFKGVKCVIPDNYTGRIIIKALKNDITVYAAHTNMDKASDGVSGLMAAKLDLENILPLTEEGLGLIGDLRKPLSVSELIETVKEKFSVEHLRSSAPIGDMIKRVALCGGSGHSFIGEAIRKGAQAYITGDISYHQFYCENGFMVMDGKRIRTINTTSLRHPMRCRKSMIR